MTTMSFANSANLTGQGPKGPMAGAKRGSDASGQVDLAGARMQIKVNKEGPTKVKAFLLTLTLC